MILKSKIEKRATEAGETSAFRGVKLDFIKQEITSMLGLINKEGFFSEYTKHDISHIDSMLSIIDWIIPEATMCKLSSAECLMLVLSVYFHDLGMLITKTEYDSRDQDHKYKKFKALFIKNSSKDSTIVFNDDEKERHIYCEFVRRNHANRVKKWIDDSMSYVEDNVQRHVLNILLPLTSQFKNALGLICESHHKNDLDNFDLYNTSERYGNSPDEKVNLCYIAIILRTADLLDITNSRTPKIEFSLIGPKNIKSLIEWEKQMAVTAVVPKEINNLKDCNAAENSGTIEIHAYFGADGSSEAYFGLCEYISYAEQELARSFNLVNKMSEYLGSKTYEFPWKHIDDKKIRTVGFDQNKLSFELDQNNILELLVGHTLYNDSAVVFRELIQNSIDAIEFQQVLDKKANMLITEGQIFINWNSNTRELKIKDNGTGMTKDDISSYLLKVGVSKYQSEDMKKNYSEFAPISKFGIGLLTCFLISDDIDIKTCFAGKEVIDLTIRGLQGRYLRKYSEHNKKCEIKKHGTIFCLKVKNDINMDNLEEVINKWILYPSADVYLQIDDDELKKIGYKNPKAALEKYIDQVLSVKKDQYKIFEYNESGFEFAFATRRYMSDDWLFMVNNRRINDLCPIGTCIKGVRVEQTTPGFNSIGIISALNLSEKYMQTTNVARSEFKLSKDYDNLLSKIYEKYKKHVEYLVEESVKTHNMSWALSGISSYIDPLLSTSDDYLYSNDQVDGKYVKSMDLLLEQLKKIQCVIIESNQERKKISPSEIELIEQVHIVTGNMIQSAENIIKETKSNLTLQGLMGLVSDGQMKLYDNLICNFEPNNILHRRALDGKAVSKIVVHNQDRRVDLTYCKSDEKKWIKIELDKRTGRNARINVIYIPQVNIPFENADAYVGLVVNRSIYLKYNCDFVKNILKLINLLKKDNEELKEIQKHLISVIVENLINNRTKGPEVSIDTICDNYAREFEIHQGSGKSIKNLLKYINNDDLVFNLFLEEGKLYDSAKMYWKSIYR